MSTFFAGVPGLAFQNHIGMRSEHFQPETGRLIRKADLCRELLRFRDHWSKYDPRPWALQHIAPEVSTRRLNDFLRQLATSREEPWTRDIAAKCNRPHLRYYPDDNVALGFPALDDLLRQFSAR